VRDIRRGGVASLDLCWVACGRLDGYYEAGGQPWDVAAGLLIATEAGATVAGLDGGPVLPESVMAATPGVAPALFELLIRAGAVDALKRTD
jgi:myo-inositol-1(or 4)-monophosphatase